MNQLKINIAAFSHMQDIAERTIYIEASSKAPLIAFQQFQQDYDRFCAALIAMDDQGIIDGFHQCDSSLKAFLLTVIKDKHFTLTIAGGAK